MRPFVPLGAQSELPGSALVVTLVGLSLLCAKFKMLFYVVSTILNVLFDDDVLIVCGTVIIVWYVVFSLSH